MDTKDIEYFRQLLKEQLNDLVDRARGTLATLVNDENTQGDPMDLASRETDRNYTLRIRDRESYLIRKIRLALEKCDDGSFGICESCGNEIPIARLMVRPVAAHCIQCKVRLENYEKAAGF